MDQKRNGWWNTIPSCHKVIIVLSVLLIIIVSATIAIFSFKKAKRDASSKLVCNTPGCVHAASEAIKIMDPTVNPCDDFYQFSCGGWIKSTQLEDKPTKSTTLMFAAKVEKDLNTLLSNEEENEVKVLKYPKKLYRICMDEESVEAKNLTEIQDVLNDAIGGWPVVLGDAWDEQSFNWIQTNYKLLQIGYSTDNLITLSADINLDNSSSRILMVEEPNFIFNSELLRKNVESPVLKLYFKYMKEIAAIFGADTSKVEDELLAVLEFESKLANASLTLLEKKSNLSALNNVMTIRELQEKHPFVPWLEYCQRHLDKIELTENESVVLVASKYLPELEAILESTSSRVVANYIAWNVISDSISYLPKYVRDVHLKLFQKLSGSKEDPPRWKVCTAKSVALFPALVGSLYVRNHFHKDSKEIALEISKYVHDEVLAKLKTLDWMDKTTKERAVLKAKDMSKLIAYPDELLDDALLNKTYYGMEIIPGNYLLSVLNIKKYNYLKNFNRLREKVGFDWEITGDVTRINAFYNPQGNGIYVTAAILQGVFFNKDRPRYMNYGAIGWVLGHEMTHGFDTTGSQFDERGNLKNWWDSQTFKQFSERAKCFIEQYDKYQVPGTNLTLKGINTKDDDIADNGGIKMAYNAYKKWLFENEPEPKLPGLDYNPKQLFWISAAQIFCEKHHEKKLELLVELDGHSLGRFRINGAFSNSAEFTKDWACSPGTPMNREKKCSIW